LDDFSTPAQTATTSENILKKIDKEEFYVNNEGKID
jgi:hypothetical protein